LSAGFVDRQQVGRRFSRVAANYDQADFFAREIDQHHVGGTEFFERHAAGFDGKNAAGTVQG